MIRHRINRLLALTLAVIMLMSAGFVLPAAAADPVEMGSLHASATNPAQNANGEIFVNCDTTITDEWQNYYAESADCVKLIKSGSDAVYNIGALTEYGTDDGILVSHNGTEFVIRNSQWNLNCAGQSGTTPLAYGDTLIVGGNFTSKNGTPVHFTTTYITKDADGNIHCSSTFEAGMLMNPTAATDGFTVTAEYNCFTDTWKNFFAEDASCVKLFRNGTVTNIGALTEYGTQDGILVTRNGNTIFVRNSQWNLNCAGHSELSPLTAGDVMYIGGRFSENGERFHVSPTYIYKDSDGNMTVSDGFNVGHLSADENHPAMTSDGYIYTCAEKGYPGDWQDYKAESADCVKLRKSGSDTAVSIGIPDGNGCTDGIIVKRGDNVFCLKSSQWLLNCAGHSELSPMAEGDVMIVEGNFTGVSDGITAHIEKTYITIKNGVLVFSASDPAGGEDEPEPQMMEAGVMQLNAEHASLNGGGFYFTMADNDIPYDAGWSNEFYATSADCIKLIRNGGEAASIALTAPGRAPFIKYAKNGYYFNGSDAWHLGDAAPLMNGDVLIIEGIFTNGTVTFHVSKSVITIGDDGALSFSTDLPVIIEAGVMKLNTEHASLTNGSFYFTMDDNDIPYDAGWSNEFYATSADCIKLIRNGGEAASIALTAPGRAPFIKYAKNGYYFNGSDAWHLGSAAPLMNGDILIIEGVFTNGTVSFHVSKSVVTIAANGSVSFGSDIPATISGGRMQSDPEAPDLLPSRSFYFTMAQNDLPVDTTWAVRYYPAAASCIKLTRNGVTSNIGNINAGTLLKFSDTRYYMALDAWAYPTALQPGDILTVEGDFVLGAATLNITKTYIAVNWDGSLSFTAEAPEAPAKPFADRQNYTVAVWNGSFHNFGMKQMYDLRVAGVNEIIGIVPYWLGSSDAERNSAMNTLLDLASLYGITVYPSLNVFDSNGNSSMWDGTTVPGYNTQHPAIGGFLIKDEPTLSEIQTLATLKPAYDANPAFAGKVFFVNLHPQSSTSVIVGSDYETYVNNLITAVHPEIIGVDVYPVNTAGNVRKIYYSNLAMLASKAKQNGSRLQYTMLSCGHNSGSTSYDVPDTALLRWQTDVALAFGASELVHYIYTSHESNYNTFANTSGEITNQALYNSISASDNEHLAWLDTYRGYTWTGTAVVNNDNNRMLNRMSAYAAALPEGTAVSSTGDVLVGIFEKNGEKAYMLTNAGAASLKSADPLDKEAVSMFYDFTMNAVTATLNSVNAGDTVEVITEGTTAYIHANADGSFTVPVPAYEGVFVTMHTHNAVKQSETSPTCTENGSEELKCSVCGAVWTETVPALGHDYVEHAAQAATCTEGGWNAYRTCSRCDYSDYTATEPLGHDWIAGDAMPATCTEPGSTPYSCSRCDATKTEPIPALGHDYVSHEAQAPTCTAPGWDAYRTCSRCAYSDYSEIAALGHEYRYTDNENGETHTVSCARCDYTASARHIYVNGVCICGAVEPVYGAVYEAITDLSDLTTGEKYVIVFYRFFGGNNTDSYNGYVFRNGNNGDLRSVTSDGYATTAFAEDADLTGATWYIEPYGTGYSIRNAYTGKYLTGANIVASGDTAEAMVIVSGKANNKTNYAIGTASSVVRYSGSSGTFSFYNSTPGQQVTGTNACNAVIYRVVKVEAPCEHDYVKDNTASVDPTCTEPGKEVFVCTKCSNSYEVTVEALGHNWVAGTTVPATCTAPGSTPYTCFRCDAEKTDTVPALGHDYVTHEAKAATCTEIGWNAYRTCNRCDYSEYKEIKALGHNYENHEGRAATCLEIGWDAYRTCTRCDFTEYKEIEALGHDIVKDARVEPTCLDKGLSEGEHCTRCDYRVAQTELAALGHNWVAGEEIPATCTEPGSTPYSCSRCTETRSDPIAALGHDYVSHEAKAPTCTEAGWNAYRTCNRCDFTEYKEINALGHIIVKDAAIEPTCLNTGLSEGEHCARCDYRVAQTELEALGHDIVKDEAAAPTCLEPGKGEGEHCTRCDYKVEQETVSALGHDFRAEVLKEPTEDAEGETGYTCSRCGAFYAEPIDKLPCPSADYTDVNQKLWYHSAVDYVIENGYMGSTKTDALTFEPNTKVSRAMVASIMYRIAGTPAVEYKGSFTDVKAGKWFTDAIEWAAQNGLAAGKGDGKFDPNGNVTRQELAVFMYKLADYLGRDVTARADLGTFPDAKTVPSWAKTYVAWAVAAGLVSGKTSGGVTKLAPTDNATRAEFASIIMRFMQ